MIIQMNEDKIIESGKYSLDKIYATLDRIFLSNGLERKNSKFGIEYLGHNISSDFACFGKIMLGLKEQTWFMDNAKKWIYCNSDSSDNPNDYDEEDLLMHYGRKTVA